MRPQPRSPAKFPISSRFPRHASRFTSHVFCHSSLVTSPGLPAARFAGGDNAPKIKLTRRHTGFSSGGSEPRTRRSDSS
jgi:hypothetical protein